MKIYKSEIKKLIKEVWEGEFDLSYLPELAAEVAADGINRGMSKGLIQGEYSKQFKFSGNVSMNGNQISFSVKTPQGKIVNIKGVFSISK